MEKTKTKYDFIAELLETEKMNSSQKERFLKGVVNELNKDFSDKKEIEKRLREIEEKINVTDKRNKTENSEEDISDISVFPNSYLNPAHLHSYLNSYNNDEILKGTCHLIDSGELDTINSICLINEYDFEIHYKKILERFEVLNSNFKDKFVDKKLKSLIHVYLNGDGAWNKNISINWNSQELHNWANENPGIPPNLDSSLFHKYNSMGFELKEIKPINYFLLEEHNISTFGKLTQYFKYLFHIRSENSISKICKNINKINKWDEIIGFNYEAVNESIELFTNVEKLTETYQRLIELILKVKDEHKLEKPIVRIGFSNNPNNDVVFSIHHVNSTYKHTVQDATNRPGQVYKNLIRNQINGVCEFKIEADFGNNEYARLNVWNFQVYKHKKMYSEKIDKVEGVKYILIFKK